MVCFSVQSPLHLEHYVYSQNMTPTPFPTHKLGFVCADQSVYLLEAEILHSWYLNFQLLISFEFLHIFLVTLNVPVSIN